MNRTSDRKSVKSQGHAIFLWMAIAILSVVIITGGSRRSLIAQRNIAVSTGGLKTVKDFGAVGDGKTDDTAAIQRAVDARTGEVRFPRGVYRVSKPILIELDRVGPTSLCGEGSARVTMAGSGPAFRFVGTHQGTAGPSTFKPNVWEKQRSPMVDGIEIVGDHPSADGLEAKGTMQLTISRVVIRKVHHAIHLVNRNRNLTIANSHIYENRGVGIYYDRVNLHQSNILGCHVSYNQGGGVVIRGGDVRNVHVNGCDIEGNMGSQESEPTANVLLDSSGGSIGEVAITGCTIQHDHRSAGSANIRINGKSTVRSFTSERRHGNITIANNVLSDVEFNIDVSNVRGIVVSGNTIWKGYLANVRIEDSESVVLQGNVFDRNPRYHYGDGSEARLGVQFRRCDGCTINGNHIQQVGKGVAAFWVSECRRLNMTNCTILDGIPAAIVLDSVVDSRVSDCLLGDSRKRSTPLRVTKGRNLAIVDNSFWGRADVKGDHIVVQGNQYLSEAP